MILPFYVERIGMYSSTLLMIGISTFMNNTILLSEYHDKVWLGKTNGGYLMSVTTHLLSIERADWSK